MRLLLGTCTLLATAIALPARSQSLIAAFEGDDPGDRMRSVIGGHDLDGDGWDDLIVGTPYDDTTGVNAGTVRAYSGKTGGLIWARGGEYADMLYGHSLAFISDVTGDGVPEFVTVAADRDWVHAHSGRTGLKVWNQFHTADGFGRALASGFDWDLDGVEDFAVGAPLCDLNGTDSGRVVVYDGTLQSNGYYVYGASPGDLFGSALSGVGNAVGSVAGFHYEDLAVGAPGVDGFVFSTIPDAGAVYFFGIGPSGTGELLATLKGGYNNGRLGASIAGVPDLDGDGFDEFVVGEPGYGLSLSPLLGRARVLTGTTHQTLATLVGDASFDQLGQSAGALEDLDGDGFDDFVVGAYPAGGYARVFSSQTGTELFTVSGGTHDNYGECVASAGDLDDDGTPDVAVSAPLHDGSAGIDTGAVWVFSGSCPGIVSYCTSGVSASGCQAQTSASGTPSASAPTGFYLVGVNLEGGKDGLFFFGWNGRQAAPWGNGTSLQCVVPPVKRAGILPGLGTSGACNGFFIQDLNLHWQQQPAHNPGAGAIVQAQLWYRDPLNTSNQTTSFSNALEFVVCP